MSENNLRKEQFKVDTGAADVAFNASVLGIKHPLHKHCRYRVEKMERANTSLNIENTWV